MCHALLCCIKTWQHLKAAPPKRPRMHVPHPGSCPGCFVLSVGRPGMIPGTLLHGEHPICVWAPWEVGRLLVLWVGCSATAGDVLGKDQR